MDLEKTLQELGLKEKKASVYLTLLRIGSGTVTEIAALSGIKRSTCYDLLDDLISRGLVNQSYKGSRRLFGAENPSRFLENHQREKDKITEAMPHLQAFFQQSTQKPTVRYYEGIESIKRAEYEILDSTSSEYYYFGSLSSMDSVIGKEFLKDLVQERVKRGIWSNALRIKSMEINLPFMEANEKYLRRVRYLSYPVFGEIATMTITDKKLYISSSSKECYTLVVESPEFVNLMKVVWHSAWQAALPT